MRVQGGTGAGQAGGVRSGAGGKTVAGGFSVGSAGTTQEARSLARAEGAVGISSVDALLALQAAGDPLERRRRAAGRGGRLLDMLDEVKLGLLSGAVNTQSLVRLQQAVREGRDQIGEPGLDDVLREIETRAAVELAKLESRRAS